MPKLSGVFDSFKNLDQIPTDDINRWLKVKVEDRTLENHLGNRMLYPQTVPITNQELQIDLSILREAVKRNPSVVYNSATGRLNIPTELQTRFGNRQALAEAIMEALELSPSKTNYQKSVEDISGLIKGGIVKSLSASLRPRIKRQTPTHVIRSISGTGSIKVVIGEEVQAKDVIGESQLSAGFFTVKLADKLKVSKSDATNYLQKPMGATIFGGELLAFKKTVFGQIAVTSPSDGVMESYDIEQGQLKLKYIPKLTPLISGVNGIVDRVDSGTGEISIKTMVTEIVGVLGAGRDRSGILNILNNGQELINSQQIIPEMSQHILVGGSVFGEALHKATEINVHGIVAGGVNMHDFRAMVGTLSRDRRMGSDSGISLMATEGFGPMVVGQDIMDELQPFNGRFVILDGNSQKLLLPSDDTDSIMALRKVAFPNVRGWSLAVSEARIIDLKVGMKVRIIFPPFAGNQGKIIAIDRSPTTLPSGVTTYMVTIETPHRKIKLPYPNIEVIGL